MIRHDRQLEAYIERFSTPLPEVLEEVERLTHLRTPYPSMLSGPVQGRLLTAFSRMISPRRILEIGTFTGYSAICLAAGLHPDGRLITLETNDELEQLIRDIFDKAGITGNTELIIGDALKILPSLEGPFDLVFIDADKRQYPDYFDLVIDKVRPGGWLIADNVLWDGKVLKKERQMDEETRAIHLFNRKVTQDDRLENFILPLRDGLMIMRKR